MLPVCLTRCAAMERDYGVYNRGGSHFRELPFLPQSNLGNRQTRPHTAQSRLPAYTANGSPRGYTRPSDGYNMHHWYQGYSCHMPSPSCYSYRDPQRMHELPPFYHVQYAFRPQNAFYQTQRTNSSQYYTHRSAPVSARTTPSNSVPGTPQESSRQKDAKLRSSCSTPTKFSRQSSLQESASNAPALSKNRKFDSYMPLCELQKALKKGEVIEGILRINPRNYEDSYISAPDGEMDIYICGIRDRNRALNGDKVAVRINPENEWKILFEMIRLRWNEWKDDLIKCVNSNVNYNQTITNLSTTDITHPISNLYSIPENTDVPSACTSSNLVTPKNDPNTITSECAYLTSSTNPISTSHVSTSCSPPSQKPNKKADVVSNSSPTVKLNEENKSDKSSKKSKNRSKKKRDKKKQLISASKNDQTVEIETVKDISFSEIYVEHQMAVHVIEDANIVSEAQNHMKSNVPDSSSQDDLEVKNVSDCWKTENEGNQCREALQSDTIQLLNVNDVVRQIEEAKGSDDFKEKIPKPDEDGSLTVMPHELLSPLQAQSQAIYSVVDNETKDFNNKSKSKFVTLEELDDEENWLDVERDDDEGDSDVQAEIETAVEDVNFILEGQNQTNNNVERSFPQHSVEVLNIDQWKTEENCSKKTNDSMNKNEDKNEEDKTLDELISDLNNMSVIVKEEKFQKNSPKKKNKKKFGAKKENNIVMQTNASSGLNKNENKNIKTDKKKEAKPKPTYGLPEFVLSLKPYDLKKCRFWNQCVQKTGKVIAILEYNHPRLAGGKLKLTADKSSSWALFSPFDSKIPRLMIPMKECPKNFFQHPDHYSQTLFMAKIEEWPDNSTFPKGSLVKRLGEVGDVEAETEMILMENDIDYSEHDERLNADIKYLRNKEEFTIPEEEWTYRRSFLSDCVFTIDPQTARDLDDALSIKPLNEKGPDGQNLFEVGVHIADVTYFLKSGIGIDLIARMRTTSVYLVQKVIPMLPRVLCEKLCSLNPGETKLTFSVVWKIDLDGNIYEEWFGRTIIRSCIKLSYELAQDMIDKPSEKWEPGSMPQIDGKWTIADISGSVNHLMAIARNLRKKRFDNGAIHINKLKLSFVLDDESGLPIGFHAESRKESNFLVEEFMLLANMAVAHKIYKHFPDLAFLRRHPPPDAKLLREFEEFCQNADIEVDISSPQAFKSQVSKLTGVNDDFSKVVSLFFLRSLQMAQYFCTGMNSAEETFHHYALNVPLYTHFTSPIRRYADVVVHRLLAVALGYKEELRDDAKDLHRLAKQCNDKKMAAMVASESSNKLFINLYIKSVGELIETGVVSQVLDHAFDVLITNLGQMARVYVDALDLKNFQYLTNGGKHMLILTWNETEERKENCVQTITAFSTVTLKISISENEISKWNVSLVK
ncbi:DIS3-like exonuclease 2 [Dinothrombium tinctorium]|uniref:DIS3-like exonuclease 2 n=1 Tax=Dinothrombium tinctorium TaxID=1965070 RepID=A0A443R0K3_9ACAR|nr:DIS3-like exonuclease 2 [Dinothrombium tinctorium]